MFTVLSDLSLVGRKDLDIDYPGHFSVSGIQGTWVTLVAGKAIPASSATKLAWPIFNEANRADTVGTWAPDVTKTKKVTVLFGKYFARTTAFSGSPTVGASLDVQANTGLLVAGSSAPVAYCVVAPRNIDYLGTTVSAMDIFVL